MDKISARIFRSEMPGYWAAEIRAAGSEPGRRYLFRAMSEPSAGVQAGRVMGATHGALGVDMFWIDPDRLAKAAFPLPLMDSHCAVLNAGEWSELMASHAASEHAAPERGSVSG